MEVRRVEPEKVKAEALEFVDDRLVAIVCRDDGKTFTVFYFFEREKLAAFRSSVQRKNPVLPTIMEVFDNAEHYEREIHEQFGVVFEGNPRLHQKFLLPDNWPAGDYPMRKDRPNVCRGGKHA